MKPKIEENIRDKCLLFLQHIDNITKEKNIIIIKPSDNITDEGPYIFEIKIFDGNNINDATSLVCYKTNGSVLKGKSTRSNKPSEQNDVINITSLYTEEAYRGKKLASLILIYAICYLHP
jgi:hypothetical protein